MSIVRNNMAADQAHRQYVIKNDNVNKSAKKLSSGYRINGAGDDAAGLAISEKMRAQIRGLDQASRNSQDGISLIQTGEGALQEMHSMLQRMSELAVQSATGTNESFDRAALNKEYEQLKGEINDISKQTSFNNIKLLDGSLGRIERVASGHIVEPMGMVTAAGGTAEVIGYDGVGRVTGTAGATTVVVAEPADANLSLPYKGSATGGKIFTALCNCTKGSSYGSVHNYSYAGFIDIDPNETTYSINQKISGNMNASNGGNGIFLSGSGVKDIDGDTLKFVTTAVDSGTLEGLKFTATTGGAFSIYGNVLEIQYGVDEGDIHEGSLVQVAAAPHFQYKFDTAGMLTPGSKYVISAGGMYCCDEILATADVNENAQKIASLLQSSPSTCVDASGNYAQKNLSIQAVGSEIIISDNANSPAVSDLFCKDFHIFRTDYSNRALNVNGMDHTYDGIYNGSEGVDSVIPIQTGAVSLHLETSSGIVKNVVNGAKFTAEGRTFVFKATDTPPVPVSGGETLIDLTGTTLTVNNVLNAIKSKLGTNSPSGNYNVEYDYTEAKVSLTQKVVSDVSAAEMSGLMQIYKRDYVNPVKGTATMTLSETGGQVDRMQNGSSVKINGQTYVFKMTPAPTVVTGTNETLIDMTGITPQSMSSVINALNAEIGPISDPGGYFVEYEPANGRLTLKQSVASNVTSEQMASLIQFNFDNKTMDKRLGKGLILQVGAQQGDIMQIVIPEISTSTLKLEKTVIDPFEEAEKSISAVKTAVSMVSETRGMLGANQNRLEHKINNLSSSSENLQRAESQIRDVDMASEMTEYQKQNIMSQAATAILAQANTVPQNVLSLLK